MKTATWPHRSCKSRVEPVHNVSIISRVARGRGRQYTSPTGKQLGVEAVSQRAPECSVWRPAFSALALNVEEKNEWKAVKLSANDLKDAEMKPLANWNGVKQLRLDEGENLRPPRGSNAKPRRLGGQWKGKAPEFRDLRWLKK